MTQSSETGRFGLKMRCLSFTEILAQAVANISPSVTPLVLVPLVFASAGAGTWLSYLLATVSMILVGANINQFATRSSSPGSLYAYVGRGLGGFAGFLAGWSMLAAYLFTAMAVLCGLESYASSLFSTFGVTLSAPVTVGVAGAIAWYIVWRDVKLSAKLMLALEAASMILILGVGLSVIVKHGTLVDPGQFKFATIDPGGVKVGLVLAIFSFVGFESAATLGEEARDPLRSIPRAMTLSTAVSGCFFMLTAYVAVLGFKSIGTSLGASATPYNDLATSVGFGRLGILIACGAVISLFAGAVASLNAASRILMTMGRHGVLPAGLARVHARNKTPSIAATAASVLVIAVPAILLSVGQQSLDMFNDFGTVATYGFLVVYVLVSVAMPIYLKHRSELSSRAILLSGVSILLMIPPLISTVYPSMPSPLDKFPYCFVAYLLIGAMWFSAKKGSSRAALDTKIAEDLDMQGT
ncbi:APC family permease [Burkholderia sp. BCC1988]|uniref:APC family permease n=1 Tax=Burkholderia sp. BCC1988 TaxID=2817443 RepID=UPI002AAF13A4|nr:APC family permease [Burkholderia sp. BCC1988]